MDVIQNMKLFEEQITCGLDVYTWQYDENMTLLHTNCPRGALLDEAFALLGGKKIVMENSAYADRPIIVSSGIGLLWAVAYYKPQETIHSVYVIGPVFSTDVTILGVENIFRKYKRKCRACPGDSWCIFGRTGRNHQSNSCTDAQSAGSICTDATLLRDRAEAHAGGCPLPLRTGSLPDR